MSKARQLSLRQSLVTGIIDNVDHFKDLTLDEIGDAIIGAASDVFESMGGRMVANTTPKGRRWAATSSKR